MRNLLQSLIRKLAPVAPKPSLDDMLTQVFKAQEFARQAESDRVLNLIEDMVAQIHEYYGALPETSYHINKTQDIILQRRCILLSQQYPKNEEA